MWGLLQNGLCVWVILRTSLLQIENGYGEKGSHYLFLKGFTRGNNPRMERKRSSSEKTRLSRCRSFGWSNMAYLERFGALRWVEPSPNLFQWHFVRPKMSGFNLCWRDTRPSMFFAPNKNMELAEWEVGSANFSGDATYWNNSSKLCLKGAMSLLVPGSC